jgi:hypothetical protein
VRRGHRRHPLSGLAQEDLADVGTGDDLASRAGDLDPARDENVGPVGHPERLERLLLDQQHGGAPVGETPHLVPQHGPGQLGRQVGGRLIEDENGRLEHQDPGYREHLQPLAGTSEDRGAASLAVAPIVVVSWPVPGSGQSVPLAGLRTGRSIGQKGQRRMFERFTDQARRVVVLAQEEARMLNHNYIGTEHLLLGLIREGEGVAAGALESLGISLEAVRQQVEEIIGQGQQAPSGHIPFTPRAKKVLELSLREALQLGHDHIRTEHILLGLILEGEGVAAQVLVTLEADLNRVRQRVILLLGDQGEGPVSAGSGPVGLAADILIRVDAIESRLSAVEQRVGVAPGIDDLDQQIRQARRQVQAAGRAGQDERAASLRDREKELLAEKASRQQQRAAAHPDLPTVAKKVRQLSDEIEQLRGLLRQQGTEPEQGTA